MQGSLATLEHSAVECDGVGTIFIVVWGLRCHKKKKKGEITRVITYNAIDSEGKGNTKEEFSKSKGKIFKINEAQPFYILREKSQRRMNIRTEQKG